MKQNIFFKALVLALLVAGGENAQAQENIMLRLRTFLNYYPVPCDSIEVSNTTQGTHTTLYYPDTVLANYNVGIEEFASESGNQRACQCLVGSAQRESGHQSRAFFYAAL